MVGCDHGYWSTMAMAAAILDCLVMAMATTIGLLGDQPSLQVAPGRCSLPFAKEILLAGTHLLPSGVLHLVADLKMLNSCLHSLRLTSIGWIWYANTSIHKLWVCKSDFHVKSKTSSGFYVKLTRCKWRWWILVIRNQWFRKLRHFATSGEVLPGLERLCSRHLSPVVWW